MRFDNFTRETCVLYIDLVETLNFLLGCLVEKVCVCLCARMAHRKKLGCLIHVCNTDALHVLYNMSFLGNYNFDLIAVS
jgi:hypothetical protein